MRIVLVVVLCFSLLFLSGCWDQLIIDELALAFAMGIDHVEGDPEMITFTMTNPAFYPEADAVTKKIVVQGYSLANAFFNMQRQRDRFLVLGQVNSMVFSEEAARSGLMNSIMREVDQSRDMNPNVNLTIVRGARALDVVYLEPPEENRVAVHLTNILERNFNAGMIPRSTASRYWFRHATKGIDPCVPVIEISGHEDEKTGIVIVGLAAFDAQGKMQGVLSDKEMIHYLILTNQSRRGRLATKLVIEGEHRDISFFIKAIDVRIRTSIVDGKARIAISLNVDVDVINVEWDTDVLEQEVEEFIETALSRDIQGNALQIISKTQRWGTDIMGFGQYVRVQNPHWFRDKDWTQEYKKSLITLEVDVDVKRIGTLLNPRY